MKAEAAIKSIIKSGHPHLRIDGKKWIEFNHDTPLLVERKKIKLGNLEFSVLDREKITEENSKNKCFEFLTRKRKPHKCVIFETLDSLTFGNHYLLYDGELDPEQKSRLNEIASFRYCKQCDQTIVWSNLKIRNLQRFL